MNIQLVFYHILKALLWRKVQSLNVPKILESTVVFLYDIRKATCNQDRIVAVISFMQKHMEGAFCSKQNLSYIQSVGGSVIRGVVDKYEEIFGQKFWFCFS